MEPTPCGSSPSELPHVDFRQEFMLHRVFAKGGLQILLFPPGCCLAQPPCERLELARRKHLCQLIDQPRGLGKERALNPVSLLKRSYGWEKRLSIQQQ